MFITSDKIINRKAINVDNLAEINDYFGLFSFSTGNCYENLNKNFEFRCLDKDIVLAFTIRI